MQIIHKLLLIFLSLSVSIYSQASQVVVLQNNNTSQQPANSQLIKIIHQKFALAKNKNARLMESISLSIGVEALEKALNSNQTINIATGITESEALMLTHEFPQKLKQTLVILRQPGFICQMELFKKYALKTNQSLGILLKNETRILYPLIKQYSKQLSIDVKTWQSHLSESLSDGLIHLMQKQDALILLAKPEFNRSSNLPVILQQAKILNKTLIASSEYQIDAGVSKGCVIKTEDWIEAVIASINQILNKQHIQTSYKGVGNLSNYKIIMPKITILE